MRLLYILSIHLYGLLLSLMAPFHKKARLMKRGRKNVWRRISDRSLRGSDVVWIHCASLGEFEQGRPVIEAIKEKHPGKKIVLTFFSPSGYEIRKNYPLADLVTYLPADTPGNAERFIDALKPEVAIFVKYEFWPFFLNTLKKRGIPLYSISAIFRKEQIFFRWYGRWFRNALKAVTKFYVQDKASGEYLASIGLNNYAVTGDTRFDRVKAIVASAKEVPEAAEIAAHASLVLVAGSTWPPDEDILARYINQTPDGVRMIIAPHEVNEARIARLEEQMEVPCFRYSRCEGGIPEGKKVMIVDTIGLLSAIYRYGHIAYIGGGFGKGIHNTLEAATYGIPVIFGPRYQKFREARELLATGGAFTVKDYRDFFPVAENLRTDDEFRRQMGEAAARYVDSMCGATRVILEEVLAHSAKS